MANLKVFFTQAHESWKPGEYAIVPETTARTLEMSGVARVIGTPPRRTEKGPWTPLGPLETKEDPR